MAGKKIRGKASEVGKLWSSSGQKPQNVRTWIGVIGPHYRRPLMDPKGIGPPANSKFHAFRPDISRFWDPFPSAYGWDILQSIPGLLITTELSFKNHMTFQFGGIVTKLLHSYRRIRPLKHLVLAVTEGIRWWV